MWHLLGGEHSVKISASLLFRFARESGLKIWSKRIAQLINQLIKYKGDFSTAPATPGLLTCFLEELIQYQYILQ